MASKEKIRAYKAEVKSKKKYENAHAVLNILAGIFGTVWTVAGSAGLLYWVFTGFLKTPIHFAALIAACAAFVVLCIVAIILGIIISYQSYWDIDKDRSIAFGICSIIFAFVLPGILYLLSMYFDDKSTILLEDPEEEERLEAEAKEARLEETKEKRKEAKKAKDPRRYFTEDDDDVGEVPDINLVDWEGVRQAKESEDEE